MTLILSSAPSLQRLMCWSTNTDCQRTRGRMTLSKLSILHKLRRTNSVVPGGGGLLQNYFHGHNRNGSFAGRTQTQEKRDGKYFSGGCFKVWSNFSSLDEHNSCLAYYVGVSESHISGPFVQKKVSCIVWELMVVL